MNETHSYAQGEMIRPFKESALIVRHSPIKSVYLLKERNYNQFPLTINSIIAYVKLQFLFFCHPALLHGIENGTCCARSYVYAFCTRKLFRLSPGHISGGQINIDT